MQFNCKRHAQPSPTMLSRSNEMIFIQKKNNVIMCFTLLRLGCLMDEAFTQVLLIPCGKPSEIEHYQAVSLTTWKAIKNI